MGSERYEEEILDRARRLEDTFITVHRKLIALRKGTEIRPKTSILRLIFINRLEAKEDKVIKELEKLISDLNQSSGSIDSNPRRLKVAEKSEKRVKA